MNRIVSLPLRLPAFEYLRRLEDGVSTLRVECLLRDSDDVDAELAGKFAVLYELWIRGADVELSAICSPVEPSEKYPAAKIAAICAGMLIMLAENKREKEAAWDS